MKVRKIDNDFLIYSFDVQNQFFSNHIYALFNGREALLIDVGYKDDLKILLDHFCSEGVKVTRIILSHYHEDHFQGLQILDDIQILGSKYYDKTIEYFYQDNFINQEKYFPDLYVEDLGIYRFGDFTLKFESAPGHSACSFYTIINNKYIHLGDNVMHTTNGEPLLPGAYSSAVDFIESLDKLLDHKDLMMIASHSDDLQCRDLIRSGDISSRINYLKKLLNCNDDLSFEEATADCSVKFLKKWHRKNLAFIKGKS